MKKLTNILILIVLSLITINPLLSQIKDQPWSVGLHANLTTYQGDLGNYWFDFGGSKLGFAVTGTRYINPFLDVRAKISYTGLEIYDEDGTYAEGFGGYADLIGTPYGSWGFDGKLLAYTLNLVFKFNNDLLLDEDQALRPFLIAGIGETRFKTDIRRDILATKRYKNRDFYYGLGCKYAIEDKYNIILEVGFHNNINDDLDGLTETSAPGWSNAGNKVPNSRGSSGPIGSVGSSNDQFLQFSLGLTYNLGKVADSDNDGVSDKKDQCPNTPAGVEVDDKGCPLDRDRDGVADYMDECPDKKGTIKGCPDRDGDKIADKKDDCPTEKGPASMKGCPDSDRDGIANKDDKCPNRRGPRANNGCPYPDTDGDGIIDKDDRCPNRRGPRTNRGCPEEQKAQKEIQRVVYFDSNSARLKSRYYSIINSIVDMMKENDASNLIIEGHTDNTAAESYNMNLSQRRAKVVKNYVVKKGISARRITSNYYGESRPTASNSTERGKQLNRRSELRLILR